MFELVMDVSVSSEVKPPPSMLLLLLSPCWTRNLPSCFDSRLTSLLFNEQKCVGVFGEGKMGKVSRTYIHSTRKYPAGTVSNSVQLTIMSSMCARHERWRQLTSTTVSACRYQWYNMCCSGLALPFIRLLSDECLDPRDFCGVNRLL